MQMTGNIIMWVTDQASGQDGWILANFFLDVVMERDKVKVHKHAKKEWGQYPTILTEQTWSIKGLLRYMAQNTKFSLQDKAYILSVLVN